MNSWRLGHLPRRLQDSSLIFSRWRWTWPRAPGASTPDVWLCVYTAVRWTMNCWSGSFKVIRCFVFHASLTYDHTMRLALRVFLLSCKNIVRCCMACLQNNIHKGGGGALWHASYWASFDVHLVCKFILHYWVFTSKCNVYISHIFNNNALRGCFTQLIFIILAFKMT